MNEFIMYERIRQIKSSIQPHKKLLENEKAALWGIFVWIEFVEHAFRLDIFYRQDFCSKNNKP